MTEGLVQLELPLVYTEKPAPKVRRRVREVQLPKQEVRRRVYDFSSVNFSQPEISTRLARAYAVLLRNSA